MAELRQEELAVLSSLIYIESDRWSDVNGGQSKKLGDIVTELEENRGLWQCGGGMKEEECTALFHAVKNSPSLSRLELFQVKESDCGEKEDRDREAPIFTYKNDGSPIVVFRGTEEGTHEEGDNVQGMREPDTEAQQHAMDYINFLHDEYGFDHISVTGHSKGGNKAMYVTVRSDYVSDCTAFDAQGFSTAFLEKYETQIAEKKDKITLIAPDRLMVGALLFPIAGKTIYTSTESLKAEDWKLEPFSYHKPNIVLETDALGNVRLREETECSQGSRLIMGMSEYLLAEIPDEDRDLLMDYAVGLFEGSGFSLDKVLSLEDMETADGSTVSSPQAAAMTLSYVFEYFEKEDISGSQLMDMLEDYGFEISSSDYAPFIPVVFDMAMDIAKNTSPEEFTAFIQSTADWGKSKGLHSWPEIVEYIGNNPGEIMDCYSSLGDSQAFVNRAIFTALSFENMTALIHGCALTIANTLGLPDVVNNISAWVSGILGLTGDKESLTDLQSVGERMIAFGADMSMNVITAVIEAGIIVLGGGVLVAAANIAVIWAVIKVLEQVIPILLNAGMEGREAARLAVAMAASWVLEKLTDLGRTIADGFDRAAEEAVRLRKLSIEAAKAMKEAVAGAIGTVISNLKAFFENMAGGIMDWISEIFGSANAAISYAQDIAVTMSRIDEMAKHILSLRQCYTDAKRSAGNAYSVVTRVGNYYSEPYVRSCCRDIAGKLKNAQKHMELAERKLEKKRRTLAAAAEAYCRSDQEAARTIRNWG